MHFHLWFTCGFICGLLKPDKNEANLFCILSTAMDMCVSGICTNIHLVSTRETQNMFS